MHPTPSPEPDKTRILVVDDHPIVREGMTQFLSLQAHLQPCGEAGNAAEALQAMEAYRPHLAIVDISLQDGSGLDLIRTLRHRYEDLRLLVMSMHEESLYAERALRAGANGYLMKHEATQKILQAIEQVLAGHIYLSTTMLSQLSRQLLRAHDAPASPIAGLSEREFEILHLIGQGMGTQDIATRLNRSIKTIEAHKAHIKEKLDIANSRELIRYAVQWVSRD